MEMIRTLRNFCGGPIVLSFMGWDSPGAKLNNFVSGVLESNLQSFRRYQAHGLLG
jgi:hypothetical protein